MPFLLPGPADTQSLSRCSRRTALLTVLIPHTDRPTGLAAVLGVQTLTASRHTMWRHESPQIYFTTTNPKLQWSLAMSAMCLRGNLTGIEPVPNHKHSVNSTIEPNDLMKYRFSLSSVLHFYCPCTTLAHSSRIAADDSICLSQNIYICIAAAHHV